MVLPLTSVQKQVADDDTPPASSILCARKIDVNTPSNKKGGREREKDCAWTK
ncbi:MAG: hypothetical protein ACI8RD_000802 [Bacillariaceae sp.]|jgi:hypothetical protein